MTAPIWVDTRTPLPTEPLGLITGYSGVAVEVRDLGRAAGFYSGALGFGSPVETPDGLGLRLNPAQSVTLVHRPDPRTFPESGVHQAYGLPAEQLDMALARLEAAGTEVHRYHEDRDLERHQNRYCADPDGNRVQIMAAREARIDHVAFETHDIEWAEVFYTQVLGARIELRVGWRMEDFARAWAWGNGEDECAPGTRRWDNLYTDDKARVPRPSPQLFVQFAEGVSLGLYLANVHRQEPQRGLYQGTPRAAFWVRSSGLSELERRLAEVRLRCMEASSRFPGPYERVGSALYVRDPSGNFLELREQPA